MNAAAQKNDGYFDCRDSFAATIEALAEADPRIVTVVSGPRQWRAGLRARQPHGGAGA